MALNNKAEAKMATVLMWVLIIGAIAYVANFGGFRDTINGFLGTAAPQPTTPTPGPIPSEVLTDTKDCPTDGTTTFTVNVQDALATTATSLYPEYYMFNGNQLVKEGTLSSSASTVSLSCGKDYDVLLFNSTAGNGNCMYPVTLSLKARIAQQTVNTEIIKCGDGRVNKVFNQAEGSASTYYNNMSLLADDTGNWGIQISANHTARGYNKPIVLCYVNTTEILDVTLDSWSDGSTATEVSVPKRITAKTGHMYYAWEYPNMLKPTDNILSGLGAIESTTTGPTATVSSNMTCYIADQATWKIAQYKGVGSIDEGFKTGPENTETQADVGSRDSTEAYLYFTNGNGL